MVLCRSSVGPVYLRHSGIQNPGVIRMSEMRSMLWIALYREVASRHEPK
jgi:hypothetical protein